SLFPLLAALTGQRSVEPARRAQQPPGEQARGRGRQPEHEEGDRVAHRPGDLDTREGDVPQFQRVDEGEEHHRRHSRGEEARPADRPDPLRERTGRVVEPLGGRDARHRAPPAAPSAPGWLDSDQTQAATRRERVSPSSSRWAGMTPWRPLAMVSYRLSLLSPYIQ